MKADTMNEKTIELSDILSAALQSGVAHNNGAGGQYLLCATEPQLVKFAAVIAGRSRAASEPGEVARLAAEACEHMAAAIRADNDQISGQQEEKARARIDRLASMATSPASEAQAGWVRVPREPTPEMQRAAEMAYRAWSDAEAPYSEFKHSDSYRAMLAAAPQPASSPVAAEGQKAVAWRPGRPEFYRHVKSGGEYEVICNAQSESHPDVTKVVYRNVRTGQRWERPASEFNDGRFLRIATPTASMADAAEAVESAAQWKSRIILEACSKWRGAQKVEAGEIIEWLADFRINATPGPRGENAGGVVEAWQPIETAPKGGPILLIDMTASHPAVQWGCFRLTEGPYKWSWRIINDTTNIVLDPTHWMPLPPAPDRGLRIAEKGDAS